MGECKHENAEHMMPGDSSTPDWCITAYAECEQFRCIDCGEWLSLGESNDKPLTVQVEMRAAYLANPDTCESEFSQAEWLGWNGDEEYIMCGSLRTVWEDMPDERFAAWEAGTLSAEIAGAVGGVLPRGGKS